ncbi:hypothetical protein EV207_1461 [Scopulibacillus darangshiensis]|uniref:Uncharacterized protein n=1 Tax=Scopulibacillus darangshiensis TaxID=442528 RepID=A0A4R2NI36_9BACL|nr:hypothetical protein EV207_1461 [Scopulibacillus darangshiensis]
MEASKMVFVLGEFFGLFGLRRSCFYKGKKSRKTQKIVFPTQVNFKIKGSL